MKHKLFISIIIAAVCLVTPLALSSCKDGGNSGNTADTTAEITDTSASADDTTEEADFDDSTQLTEKLDLYGTDIYYADTVIPHRYLIISADKIVVVLFTAETEIVTEIPKESVARVEHINAGAFENIEIYDKTGNPVTFCTTPEEVDAILTAIG